MKINQLKYWLIPTFWIVVSILMFAQEYLSNQIRNLPFDWVSSIVFKFKWLLYIPITFLVFYIGKKLPIQKPQIVQRLLVHKVISLLISTLAVFVYALFLTLLFNFVGDKKPFTDMFRKVVSTSFLNEFINYWLILAVYHGIKIFENYQQSLVEKARLEQQLSDTKLNALKMQLQPHFLFNTHHNIIGLMQKGDTEKATKMLMKLSDLLRLSLKETNDDLFRLKNEIHLLQLYLDILKIRFEERLDYNILIDSELQDAFVPPMLLQPIVENAIKYGIEPFAKHGIIEISASGKQKQLMLSVKDNGIETFTDFKFGIGLMNTQERLKNLFGDETNLNIASNYPNNGITVTITLPLLK
ncbi:sensor histidine kinase [Emticicia sp. SJ17W-69]|uniref:sensor histidine kinase n=1 Tax=Emticicia sp. SJ17W-69 TaxID=3421657 RepID=UPI003EBA897F